MNSNNLLTDRFSNADSEAMYDRQWPNEPTLFAQHEEGRQCGACSYFAPFNEDYGLCCNRNARHFTETVFEHFTCPSYVEEGWGPHSFSSDQGFMCRCQGVPVYETLATIITMLGDRTRENDLVAHVEAIRRYVEEQSSAAARPSSLPAPE